MKRQQKKDLSKLHLFDLHKSLEWCKTTLGIAPLKDVPKVRRNNKLTVEYLIESDEDTVELFKEAVYGAYDCSVNTIYINVVMHECIPSLARTFIHEYIHYLQNICNENAEDDRTWNPDHSMQEIYDEDGELMDDSLVENEAEYHAVKLYSELLKHLGYDYTHS